MNRVIIFAGGVGKRMANVSIPKQFLKVHDKPIIIHTVEKFQNSEAIDSIIIVCLKDYIDHMKNLINQYKLTKVVSVVSGGKTGQESIFIGLRECANLYGEDSEDLVLIHDGVRPVIDEKLIIDNIECAKKFGNAITVSAAVETIIKINDNDDIEDIIDRSLCRKAQAPQTFCLKDIYANHLKANSDNLDGFIDSATLMHYYGTNLHVVVGPADNIKVTTPLDYYIFKAVLDSKENEQVKLL